MKARVSRQYELMCLDMLERRQISVLSVPTMRAENIASVMTLGCSIFGKPGTGLALGRVSKEPYK